jgi:drug/metabolite transporter (DMT)-like permease
MDLATIALYLAFANAVLYGLYYALLQETYGVLSLSTILLTNGILNIVLALAAWAFRFGTISYAPLVSSRALWIFVALVVLSSIIQSTHYIALKNTSATYMAFAEISYPLFVALFTWILFSRSELTLSIALGGALIMVGSIVIARGN